MPVSLFVDIAVVSICLLTAYSFSRKGLVSIILQLVSLVAAMICAWIIPPMFSTGIYNNFVRENTVAYFEDTLASIDMSSINLEGAMLSENADIENLKLRDAIKLLPIGEEKTGVIERVVGLAGMDLDQDFSVSTLISANTLEQEVAKPVLLFIINSGLSLIVFLVSITIFNFIVKKSRIINKIPVIGTINSGLGGIIGLGMAVISMYVIMLLSSILLSVSAKDTRYGADMLKGSYSYKLFASLPVPIAKDYFVL